MSSGQGQGGGDWALGFSWGVLILLGAVLGVAGGFVGLVVYVVRSEGVASAEE